MPRHKRSKELNDKGIFISILGLVIILSSITATTFCQPPDFAQTKVEHVLGFLCSIPFGYLLILQGIGIAILVVGLAITMN